MVNENKWGLLYCPRGGWRSNKRREKMLKLREELLAVEEDRLHGSEGYSIDEVASMMRSAIQEAAGHGTTE